MYRKKMTFFCGIAEIKVLFLVNRSSQVWYAECFEKLGEYDHRDSCIYAESKKQTRQQFTGCINKALYTKAALNQISVKQKNRSFNDLRC